MGVENGESGRSVAEADGGQATEPGEALTSEASATPSPATEAHAPVEADPAPTPHVAIESVVSTGSNAAVSSWPFVGYGAAWTLFAAFVLWRLLAVPDGTPVFESSDYALTVGLGLSLTFAGPLTILVVWLSTPPQQGRSRGQLLYSSLTKGAFAMLAGVCLWWAALIIVDQIRLGRIF